MMNIHHLMGGQLGVGEGLMSARNSLTICFRKLTSFSSCCFF